MPISRGPVSGTTGAGHPPRSTGCRECSCRAAGRVGLVPGAGRCPAGPFPSGAVGRVPGAWPGRGEPFFLSGPVGEEPEAGALLPAVAGDELVRAVPPVPGSGHGVIFRVPGPAGVLQGVGLRC